MRREVFNSFDEAKDSIVDEDDNAVFYNPHSRRPIKNYNNYDIVMLCFENIRLGQRGIALLTRTDKGVNIAYILFDDEGEMTFKELWDSEPWGDW